MARHRPRPEAAEEGEAAPGLGGSSPGAGSPGGAAPSPDGDLRWALAYAPQSLAQGAIAPLVPLYAAGLGAGAASIGFMASLASLLSMFGAYVWGRTSDDARQRKPYIVAGFAGAAVGTLVLFLTRSFDLLVVGWGLAAFALAATTACGSALAAESGGPEAVAERLGTLNAVVGFASAAGLALGALALAGASTRELFLGAALLTAVSLALAVAWIREGEAFLRRRDVLRLWQTASAPLLVPFQQLFQTPTRLVRRPREGAAAAVETRTWTYLAGLALAVLAGGATWVLFPLYLEQLGLDTGSVLLVFLAGAVASALAAQPAGRLVDRVGYRRPQLGALALRAVVFLVMALPAGANVPAVTAAYVLSSLAWTTIATTGPVALFQSLPTRRKGEILALFSLSTGAGAVLGGLLAGVVVATWGFPALFLVTGGVATLSALLVGGALHPLLGALPWRVGRQGARRSEEDTRG